MKTSLKIDNLFFRDKNLSLNSDGLINLKPYFEIDLNSTIKDFSEIFNKGYVNSFLQFKKLIKKLILKIFYSYKSEKFSREIIEDLHIKTNLLYGRLFFLKNFQFSGTVILNVQEILIYWMIFQY